MQMHQIKFYLPHARLKKRPKSGANQGTRIKLPLKEYFIAARKLRFYLNCFTPFTNCPKQIGECPFYAIQKLKHGIKQEHC